MSNGPGDFKWFSETRGAEGGAAEKRGRELLPGRAQTG
jgi:hypothetical protein